jgi:hypothetical protein
MEFDTQLLCSFSTVNDLDATTTAIQNVYTLPFNKIYVLENIHDSAQLVLTYNVSGKHTDAIQPPPSTISVHRKKQTNTIYTINAINKLIEEKNNGILDKNFRINWNELKNTVLVTAYSRLKLVNTKLFKIIDL